MERERPGMDEAVQSLTNSMQKAREQAKRETVLRKAMLFYVE